MKRPPLKRSAPLRRKTWMKQRGDTKYRSRPRFIDYMKWIKRRPCCARILAETTCYGPVEADHAGKRGVGQKADDRTCIPLCRKHHQERNDFHGAFKTWNHDQMRQWLDANIERHQTMYATLVSSGIPREPEGDHR